MHRSCLGFYDMKTFECLREYDVVYKASQLSVVPDLGGKKGNSQLGQCDCHKLEDFIVTKEDWTNDVVRTRDPSSTEEARRLMYMDSLQKLCIDQC